MWSTVCPIQLDQSSRIEAISPGSWNIKQGNSKDMEEAFAHLQKNLSSKGQKKPTQGNEKVRLDQKILPDTTRNNLPWKAFVVRRPEETYARRHWKGEKESEKSAQDHYKEPRTYHCAVDSQKFCVQEGNEKVRKD